MRGVDDGVVLGGWRCRNEEAKLVAKITREMALEKKKILQRKQVRTYFESL